MCDKDNPVIKTIRKVIKKPIIYIQGSIKEAGTKNVCCEPKVGSVYGIFIKFSSKQERDEFVTSVKNKSYINEEILDCWGAIDEFYYPLYWGVSKYLGARLGAHITGSESTGTIQLNKREELKDKELIFGTMLCENYTDVEVDLKNRYPDLYKTSQKSKKINKQK